MYHHGIHKDKYAFTRTIGSNSKTDARTSEVGETLAALSECGKHGNCANQY